MSDPDPFPNGKFIAKWGASRATSVRTFRAIVASVRRIADKTEHHGARLAPRAGAKLPFNIAQLYLRTADGIREGKTVSPDFDMAVKRHQLLDAVFAWRRE